MNDNQRLKHLQAHRDQIEAKLKKKRAEVNTSIARLQSRMNSKTRKADTRRKILVGSMVLSRVEEHPDTRPALLADLDAYLDRDRDRLLFALPPKTAAVE